MSQNYRAQLLALVAVSAAGMLVACGTSAPARFFTLTASKPETVQISLTGRTILVGPVELPEYLDRPQMAVRGEQGEVTFMEFQRWAEPLQTAFVTIFTQDLMIAAGTQQVIAVPLAQRLSKDFQVLARVSRFDVDQAGTATLMVQWYVSGAEGNVIIPPRQTTYNRSATLPLKPEGSVAALSGTIADFAADVAGRLAEIK